MESERDFGFELKVDDAAHSQSSCGAEGSDSSGGLPDETLAEFEKVGRMVDCANWVLGTVFEDEAHLFEVVFSRCWDATVCLNRVPIWKTDDHLESLGPTVFGRLLDLFWDFELSSETADALWKFAREF